MGGEIGMESELGSGSTFWFELPLPLGTAPAELAEVPNHDLLSDLRVLVVDDNATNRNILEVQLSSWRMRPDLVDSAALALGRLRATAKRGQPYDLAVLDMFMPVMDGLQLAQAISADPAAQGHADDHVDLEHAAGTCRPARGRHRAVADQADAQLGAVRQADAPDGRHRGRTSTSSGRPADHQQPVGDHGSLGKILVVEDNSLNQLVAEGLLSRLGYEALSVVNGAEALDAVDVVRLFRHPDGLPHAGDGRLHRHRGDPAPPGQRFRGYRSSR